MTKVITKSNVKPTTVSPKAVLRLKLLDMIKENTFSGKKIIKKEAKKDE